LTGSNTSENPRSINKGFTGQAAWSMQDTITMLPRPRGAPGGGGGRSNPESTLKGGKLALAEGFFLAPIHPQGGTVANQRRKVQVSPQAS